MQQTPLWVPLVVGSLGLLGTLLAGLGGVLITQRATLEREAAAWQRQQSIRWDDRRLDAYVSYAAAVKRNATAVAQQLARKGVTKTIVAANLNAGLEELAIAEADRSVAFESVLILGDTATIEAGSLLNREVWRMQAQARGELHVDPIIWKDTFHAYRQTRLNFYNAARASMGVAAAAMPASSPWLEAAIRDSVTPDDGPSSTTP
ncbi:hypothetical protein [Jidongwangia harbinensis]|uniref:hypothetical protein n=1 Tax=Jidongwangia harbinensis TaxID=2878561 RepID=UPI001CDA4184|nr:hypothetical protein [Jidongwangia harbinensis]MCA2215632.1 hypothetical protein [Jidongwangia harbinensis]